MNLNHFARRLAAYFLQGLLLIVPVVVILYILYELFFLIDGLSPWELFPGAGILIIFAIITLLGFLGNTFIAVPIKRFFQGLLNRAPLVKTIYTSIADLLSAFVGQKRKFNQPVLVKLSDESNLLRLGFITEENLGDLGLDEEKIAVYLPHSYNFSGNLFIVERKNITPLEAKAADVMKFIVSGGVASTREKNEGE